MRKSTLLISGALALIIGSFIGGILNESDSKTDYHTHADFKIYINNVPIDFAEEKYMTSENKILHIHVHLHDLEGNLIHHHKKNVTMKMFFESIKMQFTNECFTLDAGESYCNENSKTLKMFVNGIQNTEMEKYIFKDLDRILITYGNEDNATIQQQIDSVRDVACIQSEKCPERGKPSDESSCTSGAGCIIE